MDLLMFFSGFAAGVSFFVAACMLHRHRSWLHRAVAERVVVHTSDDTSIEGLVREHSADGLVLAAARMVDHDVTLAGEVWVPRRKVVMIQRGGER